MTRFKKLPKTNWDISIYDLDYYGYGDVDVFIDDTGKRGERVICIFREKDLKRYEDELCYDKSLAILCNDCGVESGITSLIGLNAGQIVPIQFNGDFNPTIPMEWIKTKFWNVE